MIKNCIPARKDIPASDKWDLTSLFASDSDWEKALKDLEPLTSEIVQYKDRLADSAQTLLSALKAYENADKKLEAVYNYAQLQFTADETDSSAQDREGRARMAYTKYCAATSFFSPELQSIPDGKIQSWLMQSSFDDYRIFISKLLRMKQHILSEKEERLMSLQSESAGTADKAFTVLTDADMDFGSVNTAGEEKPLTQSTWGVFMDNPDRSVREQAYKKFYRTFESHQNTLAALYAGSVNQDVFSMRARSYKTCLERALFPDNVPVNVYHNLIDTVHKNLPSLHRYYTLRRKVLGVAELRHYDVYVPLVKNVKTHTTYDESVEICRQALAPLGTEYTDRLCSGLKNGWADRYENKGKRSGAFSSGVYTGDPFILLNYKEDVIRDVFTMAHEGGHSMHSWYSVHNNPYMQYNYTIFEAEVASTFNEELVFDYLLKHADSSDMKAYLLAMRAGDILATLHRQTMFAEYELKAHELVESGTPLSAEVLRKTYRTLLEQYFGPEMHFESNSDMEGLRIPHFYSAFYVYKYATGISASLALAKRVLEGGTAEREDYFKFLKSGGSRFPIESLKTAGVDMEQTAPVQAACSTFEKMVDQLESLLKIS
ncbi:MAG: oligoendopeptidase F [Treponema sp.]|nr:oligoendopeptidase F [Treponema sp.]